MRYNRSLLLIYFIHSSLCFLIPYPYFTSPSLPLPTGNHYFVLYIHESVCFIIYVRLFCILFKNLFIYLFIYFWLGWVFVAVHRFSLVSESGGYSLLRCVGFSLRCLLLLRSTSSRHAGFSSCGSQAQ